MLFGILCEFRRNTTNLLRRKNGNMPDAQLKLHTHRHIHTNKQIKEQKAIGVKNKFDKQKSGANIIGTHQDINNSFSSQWHKYTD